MPRNYRSEYDNYQGTSAQKKQRAKRNAARRAMTAAGKAKKGDGKDVNHKKPLSKGGTNARKNLNVVAAKKNRSFKRTRTARMK
jgi:5-methylcytosine-specific restriction endonuclease McrA